MARREKGVRLIGTDLARVDIPAKVTGGVAYVQDMRLPGMLHARVVRGPSEGTRLKPADVDAVAKMPGVVQVVRDGGFTAVLATQEWQAIKALQRLQSAGWDRPGAKLPAEDMREAIRRLPSQEVLIFDYPGPPAPSDGKVVKARYSRPCLMHGAIGPSCAVASGRSRRHRVDAQPGRLPAAKSCPSWFACWRQVRCIHTEGSGRYDHNRCVAADAALPAPSRASGAPAVDARAEHGWEPLGSAIVVTRSRAGRRPSPAGVTMSGAMRITADLCGCGLGRRRSRSALPRQITSRSRCRRAATIARQSRSMRCQCQGHLSLHRAGAGARVGPALTRRTYEHLRHRVLHG